MEEERESAKTEDQLPSWYNFEPYIDKVTQAESAELAHAAMAEFLMTTIGRMSLRHVLGVWFGEQVKQAVLRRDENALKRLNRLNYKMSRVTQETQ